MRIAILTSARSGSTSLFHLFEKHLYKKYNCISEPFNNHWRDKIDLPTYDVDFFNGKDDILIKTFVSKNQRPKSLMNNDEQFWKWFFSYFDKVVLLNRLDKELQSESLTYHLKTNDIHSWQKPQFYDLSNITNEEIENSKNILIEESKMLYDFSKMGFPLYYFEDIFIDKNKSAIEDMFKYVGIKLENSIYEKFVGTDLYKVRIGSGSVRFKGLI